MKHIVYILFSSLTILCTAQEKETCITQREYDIDEGHEVISELDTILNCYCGAYKEFDSLGILLIDGQYSVMDSIKCKDCYEGHFSPDSLYRNWTKYEFSQTRSLKTGVWKYYYPNGKLKMKGGFSDKVHECRGSAASSTTETMDWNGIEIIGGPINGWIDFEYLKNGIWTYFDEFGNPLRIEDYIDGTLIYTMSYQ